MDPTSARQTTPWLVLGLLLALTVVACAPVMADDPTAIPGSTPSPTTDAPAPTPPDAGGDLPVDDPGAVPGGGGVAPGDGGALPVSAEPGIVDARPHAWDHISVAPDGTTVTIYYWGGVQDCYGLAGVDVQRGEDGLLKLTVLEGRRGHLPPDTACIEIAVLKAVTIDLDQPLVAPQE